MMKTFKPTQYKYKLQSRLKGSNDKWGTEFTFEVDKQRYLSESIALNPNKEFRVINNPKYNLDI